MLATPMHPTRLGALLGAAIHPARSGQHRRRLARAHRIERVSRRRGAAHTMPQRIETRQRVVEQIALQLLLLFILGLISLVDVVGAELMKRRNPAVAEIAVGATGPFRDTSRAPSSS